MTNQLQGEVLFQGWSGTTAADWCYTPWMPVRGDEATFGVEVLGRASSVNLNWNVETRTSESTSVEEMFTTDILSNAVGVKITAISDISVKAKELVRYKFRTGDTASTTDYVHFRALQPSWQADR